MQGMNYGAFWMKMKMILIHSTELIVRGWELHKDGDLYHMTYVVEYNYESMIVT